MYVRELRVQYRLRRLPGPRPAPAHLHSPEQSGDTFLRLLQHEPVEVCGLLCLSTSAEVVAYHELSRGTLDRTIVNPRDVLRVALLANARSVILGHNHPSGDPTPSAEDLALTRRLVHAGSLVDLTVLDHIIVGHDRYVSLRQAGHL